MPPPVSACAACSGGMNFCYSVAGFEIRRCSACGLGQTVIPDGFDVSRIYDESYFQGGQADGYADYQGSRDTLSEEFRQIVKALVRSGTAGGALLEVGCAYGFFLDEAKVAFDVRGVELADHARQTCRERGLRVANSIDDASVQEGVPFDAVVMLDVIEHLPHPGDVLRKLGAMTRPGGRIVLTTGDFGSLAARWMGPRWRLMTPPQHLWFFTVDALRRLLEDAGFRVEHVEHPGKRVPLSLIAYQLGRMLSIPGGWKLQSSVGVPVNLFDAMRIVAKRA